MNKYYYKQKIQKYTNGHLMSFELCLNKNKGHNNKANNIFDFSIKKDDICIGSNYCKNCNCFKDNGIDEKGAWVTCLYLIKKIRKRKLEKLKKLNTYKMKNINYTRPKVGVRVIIKKDGKVLVGKRKGSHGEGTWSYPGGHMEGGEKWNDTAIREVLEETGLKIKNIKFGTITNDIFEKEQKHYVTIVVVCDYDSGELKNLEPEKCSEWRWVNWDEQPEPVFKTQINLRKENFNPFFININEQKLKI